MQDQIASVKEFHQIFGGYISPLSTPTLPTEILSGRIKMLREEMEEYIEAAEDEDLVGIADALTDLLYVVLGTYIAHGLHPCVEALFDEVHRSNMTKLDENGAPILRADGKILKSQLYKPPDISSVLAACKR